MRLTDDYQYEFEEEEKEEKEQQTSKKGPLKKPTKDDVSNFNELLKKKKNRNKLRIISKPFSVSKAKLYVEICIQNK